MRKSYFLKWPTFCEVKQAFSNQTIRKWCAFPYILGAFNNTLEKVFNVFHCHGSIISGI